MCWVKLAAERRWYGAGSRQPWKRGTKCSRELHGRERPHGLAARFYSQFPLGTKNGAVPLFVAVQGIFLWWKSSKRRKRKRKQKSAG